MATRRSPFGAAATSTVPTTTAATATTTGTAAATPVVTATVTTIATATATVARAVGAAQVHPPDKAAAVVIRQPTPGGCRCREDNAIVAGEYRAGQALEDVASIWGGGS